MTITGLSVAVALIVGSVEVAGLAGPGIDLNVIGLVIVAVFVLTSAVALLCGVSPGSRHPAKLRDRWACPCHTVGGRVETMCGATGEVRLDGRTPDVAAVAAVTEAMTLRGPESAGPGLANHEPQPTAAAFVDFLFPGQPRLPQAWTPEEPPR